LTTRCAFPPFEIGEFSLADLLLEFLAKILRAPRLPKPRPLFSFSGELTLPALELFDFSLDDLIDFIQGRFAIALPFKLRLPVPRNQLTFNGSLTIPVALEFEVDLLDLFSFIGALPFKPRLPQPRCFLD
jgi:hypothetical protein